MLEAFMVNSFSFRSYTELNDNLLYLDYIKANYENSIVNIQPDVAYRFIGNFYGLLRELNIDPSLFLYTLYINEYNNPTEYNGLVYTLQIPTNPPIPIN